MGTKTRNWALDLDHAFGAESAYDDMSNEELFDLIKDEIDDERACWEWTCNTAPRNQP